MHDADTRSLRRAAAVLFLVSLLRWGSSFLGGPSVPDGPTILDELVPSAIRATEDRQLRSRPLGPSELVDPNRASDTDLDRLPGIGPAAAAAIIAARDTGVVFRRPRDLMTVRGIGPALLERISKSLDLGSPPPRRTRGRSGTQRAPDRIDLNYADSQTLQGLPGVGPALADRIIRARGEQLFRTVEDLARVSGIGPATVARLRALTRVGR
jgi:competence ComEA-like helix-hairpin-helix protein